jgi:hypothetical protein
VVVGDEHVHAPRLGVSDGLVGGDAGVTRQHQIDPLGDELLQHGEVDAMGLPLAVGDVIPDDRPQIRQGGDQKGSRRLPVHVEVTPHADRLFPSDGFLQPLCRPGHVGEIGRWSRPVAIGIEEGFGRLNRGKTPPDQGLGHQRMPANSGLQGVGHFNLWKVDPFLHGVCPLERET